MKAQGSVDFFKLGIEDSVATTIKHLDEYNVICQGFHSIGKKDLFGWLTLSSAFSKHQILGEGFHQPLHSWITVLAWPLFFFPVINVCKNESSSLGTFIALSARSDRHGGHDILFSVL